MFVELIELLRCPRVHEEAQLVAAASRTEARHIVDGILGCPVCNAEFPIVNGVVRIEEPETATPWEEPSAEVGMRLAAFLELTDARGFALLCGRWAAHADVIQRLTETSLILVNPPPRLPSDIAAGVVLAREVIPFAAGSARAAAIAETASPEFARSAVRAVRPGGRLVGSAALAVPAGVSEIARDEHMWVGGKASSPEKPARLVPLRRAGQPGVSDV